MIRIGNTASKLLRMAIIPLRITNNQSSSAGGLGSDPR